jgi:hypothetical protein
VETVWSCGDYCIFLFVYNILEILLVMVMAGEYIA